MKHIKDLNCLTREELALLWGVSTRTIQRLPEAETLRHGTGQGSYYVWEECRTQNPSTKTGTVSGDKDLTDRDRKLRAEADLAVMAARKMEGQLIPAADVETEWVKIAHTVRTKLLALPTKARMRLPHLVNEDVLTLDALVRECLEELYEHSKV